MKIDWFTVIAQICNLLVLLWILKKLLYKPILEAIADREEKINNQIKTAEEREKEADKIKKDFQIKSEAFDQHKKEIYKKLEEEIKSEKIKQLAVVSKEAESVKDKLTQRIQEEKENSIDELIRKMEMEVLATSEKVLKDLSDTSIQDAIVGTFVRQLRTMHGTDKIFRSERASLTIRSAFELTTSQKEMIEKEIGEDRDDFKNIHYEKVPELICGIELTVNNHRTGWNIRDYLNSFKELIQEK